MVQWFCLYHEDYLMDEGHAWDNGSVWPKDWSHTINRRQWLIFHGPVILLNILKSVWMRNVILGIMHSMYDTLIEVFGVVCRFR